MSGLSNDLDDMGGMSGVGGQLPPIGLHSLLTQWDVRLGWTVLSVILLAGYLLGLRRRSPQGKAVVGPWRVTAWVAGVVVLWLATNGAVERYSMTVYYMHMIQHLLLITVAPALLVIGHPLTVLAEGRADGRVARALRTPALALLTRPLVGFLGYAATIVLTHLTGFMDTMMGSSWLPSAEQALYLFAGCLYLLPILGNEPIRWRPPALLRVLLLVGGMIPDTIVGIVLLQTNSNIFPSMLTSGRSWAPDPVADIETGGGLMWALGDGLMMVLAVGVVVAMISAGDRSPVVGTWLEGVRRSTLQDHTGLAQRDDVDVDTSDEALDAYNAMLRRMGGSESPPRAVRPPGS